MVPRSISFTDLAKVPGAVKIMERNDKREIEQLLSQMGFDVRLGFEINVCTHRALTTNQAVHGPRIEGYELSTPEWLSSGMASVEARMESCEDHSLRDELLKLNKTGTSDKAMTDEGVAKSVVNKEKKI